MKSGDDDRGLKISGFSLRLAGVVLSLAAAYFLTIQSLKVEMAAKAESAVVESLDKKLINIEVMLKEGVVTKEQFFEFSKDMEARLTRIEAYLRSNTGEPVGKN